MTTQEYHETLLKYHCRYTQLHSEASHHEIYGIYITAESQEEAEAILRKLRPKALKVRVYDGIQVYAHAKKSTMIASVTQFYDELDLNQYKPRDEFVKLQKAIERAMKYETDESVLKYLKSFVDNY